ncbi:MAG: hypothetical protein RR739_04320, partial [Clostridia bacterium]
VFAEMHRYALDVMRLRLRPGYLLGEKADAPPRKYRLAYDHDTLILCRLAQTFALFAPTDGLDGNV